jgi:F-type H+-transporting ATPase subunit gamma
MASLKDIRRRIGSVKSTQQITKAMKLVAASRLRRAQMAITGARPYAEKLEETTGRIVTEITSGYSNLEPAKKQALVKKLHPLLRSEAPAEVDVDGEQPKPHVALIVITSDRGLCGAYNTNAIKNGYRRYQELAATNKVSLFFVGRRGYDFFRKRGLPGHYFEDFWQGSFSTRKSDVVADMFIEKFLAGEFDCVEACFTRFRSAIAQFVEHRQILPIALNVAEGSEDAAALATPFIYEPEKKKILGSLLPKQVRTQFYRVCADSLASEFGSRMTAMDNATRNASEMISKLTLQANRVRQASITNELMEIIGGAEAIKG